VFWTGAVTSTLFRFMGSKASVPYGFHGDGGVGRHVGDRGPQLSRCALRPGRPLLGHDGR
jgi:hypothetical protein